MKTLAAEKIPVAVFFAPTASGKTALMKDLFSPSGSHFILNGEVISADSQQVYKYMNIGTAKATDDFLKEVPHHLIDFLLPDQQFNVSDFVDMADSFCRDIFSRGKLPVVCGGSGFYIRNFLFGVSPTPQSNPIIREKLQERAKKEGSDALYEELLKIDSKSASKIHPNDVYRITRALEVFYLSGKKRSEYPLKKELRDSYNFLFIILKPPRELLYEKIRERVDMMLCDGLKDEIEFLIKSGYDSNSPGMKAIGYKEWFDLNFFSPDNSMEQKCLLEQVGDLIKHNSCKYAKKQYTYIKDIPFGTVIDYNQSQEDLKNIHSLVRMFCTKEKIL